VTDLARRFDSVLAVATNGRADGARQTNDTSTITLDGRTATLVCHMAVLSGQHRRNSIDAIRDCFGANVARMEIDVHSLAGDDYAVYHERRLEHDTTGTGTIGRATPDEVRSVRYLDAPGRRPPLLSEVVDAARGCQTQIQLDLKDWRPMSPGRIRTLLRVVAPIRHRVIVSTGQDWNLRRLHDADPTIAFGFDPGHYLDHAIEGADVFLPRTMGAYGYRDDHPMAFGRTEATTDYLYERMEMLMLHAPGAREFFLSYKMVLQMLDDGFNPIAFLRERGVESTVWTPDYHGHESLRMLARLLRAGVDRVTTNTLPAWKAAAAERTRSAPVTAAPLPS
jgi:glycerophosphoryl diester phosphodiesterase